MIVKWVKALRSGKYQQAHHRLKDGKALCCIGVGYLCAERRRPRFEKTRYAWEAIGLNHAQAAELINMNDWNGKSFGEIADYIEANL